MNSNQQVNRGHMSRRRRNRNNRGQQARNSTRGLQNQNSQGSYKNITNSDGSSSSYMHANKYDVPADLYKRYAEGTNYDHKDVIPCSKQYPVTSRGFGFLINKYCNELTGFKAFDRNLIHVIYRITLWQLEVQLSKSEKFTRRYTKDDYIIPKENFYLVAVIIGIIGKFTDQFHIEYTPIMFDRNPFESRNKIYDENDPPDPYTVSIRNLRAIVEFLSDTRSEYRNAREHFYRNNPIPDAKWDEDYVLQNADMIKPREYNIDSDIIQFNNFMCHLKSKFRGLFSTPLGTCLLDGSGEPAALASVEPNDGMALHNEDMTDALLQFSHRIGCMIPLSKIQMLVGFIGLVGERPPYKNREDIWCIRSPNVSCKYMFQNWIRIVDWLMRTY